MALTARMQEIERKQAAAISVKYSKRNHFTA
jgi:hypothetical protein